MSVTETLISQQVELLFIAGVRNPTPLDDLCSAAGIPCINVDLPGPGAPSVVSDNRGGARALTDALMEKMIARGNAPGELLFLGGVADEYATEMRISGYRDAFEVRGISPAADAVECFGYGAVSSRRALARRYESLGRLPAGLLMNSITAFEGLVQFASRLPREAWHSTVVGCFDWDPFAVHLPFEVTMMRQDVQKIILEAFALADSHDTTARPVVVVPTGFGQMLDEDELPIRTEYES
jgi:LacI family fructose operon transcriptional repressor